LTERHRSAARISAPNISFKNRAFTEGIGNDLEAPPLLNKQPFEQVGGADCPPMRHREAQVGDAGFEVVPLAEGVFQRPTLTSGR
jgi:hypothetical protein